MITIQIDGKTYIARRSKMSMLMPISEWISKWYLEEVKEKPLSQKRAEAIERGKQHSTEYYSALSILEKLREELKKRIVFLDTVSTIWMENIRIKECEVFLDLLTSLETKEEPNLEEEFAKDFPNTWCQEQPQFTPWQEIEVSNDGEKWEKRTFQNMIKEKFQCWQTEEEHNKTTMFLKLWQFARPLEQVTIPEFDYDKIHMEAMKDHVGSFATHVAHPLCKQMSEITHFLHSQFPNSKPK